MERTKVTITFTNIRTSKSTYYLLYDKSHSKTHHTTLYFRFQFCYKFWLHKLKNRKNRRFQLKNRRKQEQAQKIGKNRNWTPCVCVRLFIIPSESTDCIEYPKKFPTYIKPPQKNASQMFLPQKVSEAKMSNPNIPSIMSLSFSLKSGVPLPSSSIS